MLSDSRLFYHSATEFYTLAIQPMHRALRHYTLMSKHTFDVDGGNAHASMNQGFCVCSPFRLGCSSTRALISLWGLLLYLMSILFALQTFPLAEDTTLRYYRSTATQRLQKHKILMTMCFWLKTLLALAQTVRCTTVKCVKLEPNTLENSEHSLYQTSKLKMHSCGPYCWLHYLPEFCSVFLFFIGAKTFNW